MDVIDLELNFLEGNPIELEPNLNIHKVSISQINKKKIGYLTYNHVINMICLDKDDIKKFVNNDNIDVYTFLLLYAYQSYEEKKVNKSLDNEKYFIDELISVLQLIFNDTIVIDVNTEVFHVGKNGLSLNRNNFYQFQSIIKKRNCLENIDEEIENPDNEMARSILAKRKKAREKLAKAKARQNDEDDLTPLNIADLISIYAQIEHMKLEEIFQYDFYQFNNQFNRMKIFEDYDVNIQALLAGAKSEEINLQHWLSKIK